MVRLSRIDIAGNSSIAYLSDYYYKRNVQEIQSNFKQSFVLDLVISIKLMCNKGPFEV